MNLRELSSLLCHDEGTRFGLEDFLKVVFGALIGKDPPFTTSNGGQVLVIKLHAGSLNVFRCDQELMLDPLDLRVHDDSCKHEITDGIGVNPMNGSGCSGMRDDVQGLLHEGVRVFQICTATAMLAVTRRPSRGLTFTFLLQDRGMLHWEQTIMVFPKS
jgi:hypothetical protein